MEKIHCVHKELLQFEKSLVVLLDAITAKSVNCSLFLKNLEKHFCNLTYKKKLRQTYGNFNGKVHRR